MRMTMCLSDWKSGILIKLGKLHFSHTAPWINLSVWYTRLLDFNHETAVSTLLNLPIDPEWGIYVLSWLVSRAPVRSEARIKNPADSLAERLVCILVE